MTTDTKHPILIVDDEPDVLFSLKGLLRRDFVLHTAESGDEALQILQEHPIHVIMTDQRMPGMSGVELMNQAKARFPSAIRVIFTGYADIKAVIEAINTGGLFRYITKPWDPDELIDTLHLAAKRYEDDADRQNLGRDLKSFTADVAERLGTAEGEVLQELLDRGRKLAETAEKLFAAQ